jgi:hypothetical protein
MMKPKAKQEMTVQKNRNGLKPMFKEDKEALRNYPDNILLRITITHGEKKQRSLKQHGLFRACLEVVADYCRSTFTGDTVQVDKEWDTAEKVLTQTCMAIGWYKQICVTPNGTVIFERKSTSFKAMEHKDAVNVYSKAMDSMSEKIGYTIEQLIGEAQDRMG